MQGLHTLKAAPHSKQRKTRVGRGPGSGIGTYSGRGIKGQRSRTGGKKGLTARSMKPYLLRIPKSRGKGFDADKKFFIPVTLRSLEQKMENGAIVTMKLLRQKGLIRINDKKVKIIGNTPLTKSLTLMVHSCSKQARAIIEKAGGKLQFVEKMDTKPAKKS